MHSIYSPSSSNRWLKCPGSLFLRQEPSGFSINTNKGLLIHNHVHDSIINKTCFISKIYELECTDEQQILLDSSDEMEGYVNYINSLNLSDIKVEEKIDLGRFIPGCFGTADVVGTADDTLHIIDLKTGLYKVNPYENYQLMFYALGHYDSSVHKHIKLHIYQYNKPFVYRVTDEFFKDIKDEITSFLNQISTDKNSYNEGKWCKFCPAIVSCPLKKGRIEEARLIGNDPPELLKFKDLESLYISKMMLEPLFLKVQKLMEHEMIENQVKSDFVFASIKKGRRVFKKDALMLYAEKHGMEDKLLSPKPKTLAEVKKYLSADILEDLTEMSEIPFIGLKDA